MGCDIHLKLEIKSKKKNIPNGKMAAYSDMVGLGVIEIMKCSLFLQMLGIMVNFHICH